MCPYPTSVLKLNVLVITVDCNLSFVAVCTFTLLNFVNVNRDTATVTQSHLPSSADSWATDAQLLGHFK